jgi:hypothetical protein
VLDNAPDGQFVELTIHHERRDHGYDYTTEASGSGCQFMVILVTLNCSQAGCVVSQHTTPDQKRDSARFPAVTRRWTNDS